MNLAPEQQAAYDAHQIWLESKGKEGYLLNWTGSDLDSIDLSKAYLFGAILSGANLYKADLSNTYLFGVNLSKANLDSADISRANMDNIVLRGANLTKADLTRATLRGADLTNANLRGAHLVEADLRRADLCGAHLDGAHLHEANLSRANLLKVHLIKADLSGTNMSDANLSETNITGAKLGWTIIDDVNLSTTKGLDQVVHWGPSSIGIGTLSRSKGIPDAFLRGAGIPEQFIEYYRSLVGTAIEYYSCFISYSSKNQEFAERLYADLQIKNVRCYYAPEDLPTGAKSRVSIDQAIRIHDKLLLIMSESSINSQWVEQEVETALKRERLESHLVLFPIRIDNAVFESDAGWASLLCNTRNIGNFCQWKDHDAYQKAFQRLLRDLKT